MNTEKTGQRYKTLGELAKQWLHDGRQDRNTEKNDQTLQTLLEKTEKILRDASISELIKIGAERYAIGIFPEPPNVLVAFADDFFFFDFYDQSLHEYWDQFGLHGGLDLPADKELLMLDDHELAEFVNTPAAVAKAEQIRQRSLAALPQAVLTAYEGSLKVLAILIEIDAAKSARDAYGSTSPLLV